MKKNLLPVLIVALVIAQIVSLVKIFELQNNLEYAINTVMPAMSDQLNYLSSEINSVYANVDEMLKKGASPIETASIQIGELDTSNLSVPITFSVTPKEVSESTIVNLEIDGELIAMDKKNTTFTATVVRGILSETFPLILIDENGLRETAQDNRLMIWNIKVTFLPQITSLFDGEYSTTSKDSSLGDFTFDYKGTLQVEAYSSAGEAGIVFTDYRFVIKVDKEIISDEPIPIDKLDSWQVEGEVPLKNGQDFVMAVIATDSIGIEHHYTINHFTCGSDLQSGPWNGSEQLFTTDGTWIYG